jgi:hypothetical protein
MVKVLFCKQIDGEDGQPPQLLYHCSKHNDGAGDYLPASEFTASIIKNKQHICKRCVSLRNKENKQKRMSEVKQQGTEEAFVVYSNMRRSELAKAKLLAEIRQLVRSLPDDDCRSVACEDALIAAAMVDAPECDIEQQDVVEILRAHREGTKKPAAAAEDSGAEPPSGHEDDEDDAGGAQLDEVELEDDEPEILEMRRQWQMQMNKDDDEGSNGFEDFDDAASVAGGAEVGEAAQGGGGRKQPMFQGRYAQPDSLRITRKELNLPLSIKNYAVTTKRDSEKFDRQVHKALRKAIKALERFRDQKLAETVADEAPPAKKRKQPPQKKRREASPPPASAAEGGCDGKEDEKASQWSAENRKRATALLYKMTKQKK